MVLHIGDGGVQYGLVNYRDARPIDRGDGKEMMTIIDGIFNGLHVVKLVGHIIQLNTLRIY